MGGWVDRLIDVKPTTPWVKIFKRLVQVYLIYLDIWTGHSISKTCGPRSIPPLRSHFVHVHDGLWNIAMSTTVSAQEFHGSQGARTRPPNSMKIISYLRMGQSNTLAPPSDNQEFNWLTVWYDVAPSI